MNNPTPGSGREAPARQRNPLLLLLGVFLLGVALAFILFGGDLLTGNVGRPAADSGQSDVPAAQSFGTPQTLVAELTEGTSGAPQVGEAAPNFVVVDLEGNVVTLADYRGRPVIVNFWATWCAPCRIEMPELEQAYQEYGAEELAILAVNYLENEQTVTAFFYDEMGLTFTPLLDEEGLAANLFNVFNMPTTFFVDAAGTITAVHRGPMTSAQIDGYLENTLSDRG